MSRTPQQILRFLADLSDCYRYNERAAQAEVGVNETRRARLERTLPEYIEIAKRSVVDLHHHGRDYYEELSLTTAAGVRRTWHLVDVGSIRRIEDQIGGLEPQIYEKLEISISSHVLVALAGDESPADETQTNWLDCDLSLLAGAHGESQEADCSRTIDEEAAQLGSAAHTCRWRLHVLYGDRHVNCYFANRARLETYFLWMEEYATRFGVENNFVAKIKSIHAVPVWSCKPTEIDEAAESDVMFAWLRAMINERLYVVEREIENTIAAHNQQPVADVQMN